MERELSAKLTEGLLNEPINMLAYPLKVAVNFIVGDSQYGQVELFQKSRSLSILSDGFVLIMLRPIQFHHQICFGTIKINDIGADHLLPSEFYRITTEKIIPQMPLFFGHVFPQCFGIGNHAFVVLIHDNPSDLTAFGHLPFHKGGFFVTSSCRNPG